MPGLCEVSVPVAYDRENELGFVRPETLQLESLNWVLLQSCFLHCQRGGIGEIVQGIGSCLAGALPAIPGTTYMVPY